MERKRHMGQWTLAGLVMGGATAWLCNAYRHRPVERVASREACDIEPVVEAYERMAGLPQMALLRQALIHRAKRWVSRGMALDLGCGSGQMLMSLARQIPGLRLVGLDMAAEMLVRTQARWRAGRPETSPSLCQGSGAALPVRDAAFDLVTSSLSLHHWADPVGVLTEIRRVLAPGGTALVLDLRRDMVAPAWMLLYAITRCVAPRVLREINEPLGSRDAAYTPVEAAAFLKEAGWTSCRVVANPLFMVIVAHKV